MTWCGPSGTTRSAAAGDCRRAQVLDGAGERTGEQAHDGLTRAILADLKKLGRYGVPVPNLYNTAVAGTGFVPGGEVVKWHADHSGDREKAVDALTTATARVVPFACTCDDVRHSCSSPG